MITVWSSLSNAPEFIYVCDYVFRERLGLTYQLVKSSDSQTRIEHQDKALTWKNRDWSQMSSPQSVFIDESMAWLDEAARPLNDNYDFLYAIFVVLSRFEELENSYPDRHGRFPLAASFLARLNLLERPVVDEHVAFIREELQRVLNLPNEVFRTENLKRQVSFDVDQPRNPAYDNWISFFKAWLLRRVPFWPDLIGDSAKFGDDSYFTFPYLFSRLRPEHHAHIFFIAQRTNKLDGTYDLDDHCIRHLRILAEEQKMVVGVHGSYDSFDDVSLLSGQRRRMNGVTDIRQHFLRFSAASTWKKQLAAGFKTDWSLGFAEAPGFRAGTCHPFRPYSFEEESALEILVEPLLLMDVSLTEKKYLDLKTKSAMVAKARPIFNACQKFGGHFNVLFHNPTMLSSEVRDFYEELLSW